ncbi:ArsR/SmtB family transcription factor [Streptomyces sp. NPDC057376]|uniref:ArsR/SmtB family transcription factor n=1 Tax=unclassified Streptomyces TaxID=2593676 RepID=UPI00093990B2|nr:metalloregulator ArsR/SmtB family transcription factor [Streptomyces sp. CB02414]
MIAREPVDPTDVFKALSDPMRWKIIQQLAAEEGEYACSLLEEAVPVSKPTISYHTKLLAQAGLIKTHKRGRKYYYVLQRDVLHEVIDTLWGLAPHPRGKDITPRAADAPPLKAVSGDSNTGTELVTW